MSYHESTGHRARLWALLASLVCALSFEASPAWAQQPTPIQAPAGGAAPDTPAAAPNTTPGIVFRLAASELMGASLAQFVSGDAHVRITMQTMRDSTGAIPAQRTEIDIPALGWMGIDLGHARFILEERPLDGATMLQATIRGAVLDADVDLLTAFTLNPLSGALTLPDGDIAGSVRIALHDPQALAKALGLPAFPLNPASVQLNLNISGALSRLTVDARLRLKELESHGKILGDLAAHWTRFADEDTRIGDRITLDYQRPDASGLRMDWAGTLAFDPVLLTAEIDGDQPIKLSAEGTLRDQELRALGPLHSGIEFDLNVHGSAAGKLKALDGEWSVRGPIKLGKQSFPAQFNLNIAQGAQHLDAQVEELFTLQLRAKPDLVRLMKTDPTWLDAPLEGQLDMALRAASLAVFLPALHKLQGKIEGAARIAGSIGTPTLDGAINWQDGGATWTTLNRRIKPLAAALTFSGTDFDLRVDGQAPTSPSIPGLLKLATHGTLPRLQWDEFYYTSWQAAGDLSVGGFPWVQRHYPISVVTGQGEFELTKSREELLVNLQLANSSVQVSAERMPKAASIPMNPDIVVLDAWGNQTQYRSMLEGAGRLRLDLSLRDPLKITGQGNQIEVTGDMELVRDGQRIQVRGGFEPRGTSTFMLFENPMTLSHGIVTLAAGDLRQRTRLDPSGAPQASPLEPIIELVAHGEVENTTVLVRLTGPLSRPSLTLASRPAIPDYEIISLLVTGRADAISDRNSNVRKAAEELVERYHNPSLQRQLFAQIGIDKLGFGFGSSVTNPILTVGKQLTKNLYVETIYHHDAPWDANTMEGRIEQRLTPAWTFDTAFGDAAEGRLGFFWKARFGAPPPPAFSPEEWAKLNTFERAQGPEEGDKPVANAGNHQPPTPRPPCPYGPPRPQPDELADRLDSATGDHAQNAAPCISAQQLSHFQATPLIIAFPPNQATPDADDLLIALAELMRRYPFLRAHIVGHSDARGDEAGKQRVSEARAQNTAAQLLARGIEGARLQTEGAGDSKLLNPAPTDDADAENRRTEILLELRPTEPHSAP